MGASQSSMVVNTYASADMTSPLNCDEHKSRGHSETTGLYSSPVVRGPPVPAWGTIPGPAEAGHA